MPWTDPPDFADDDVLTATNLNKLSDDLEFLHGLITGVNVPFRSVDWGTDVDPGTYTWRIRHLGRYLHYKIVMTSGEHDDLVLYYDDDNVFQDAGHQVAPYTWSGVLDLHDTGVIASTPTIGETYAITFEFTWQEGETGGASIWYLFESDSDTL